jgi:hypothetical protein
MVALPFPHHFASELNDFGARPFSSPPATYGRQQKEKQGKQKGADPQHNNF